MNIRLEEETPFILCSPLFKFNVRDYKCTLFKENNTGRDTCIDECPIYQHVRAKQRDEKCLAANKLLHDGSRSCNKFKVGETINCRNCTTLAEIVKEWKSEICVCDVIITNPEKFDKECKNWCKHAGPHYSNKLCVFSKTDCEKYTCVKLTREIYDQLKQREIEKALEQFKNSSFGIAMGESNDTSNILEH